MARYTYLQVQVGRGEGKREAIRGNMQLTLPNNVVYVNFFGLM